MDIFKNIRGIMGNLFHIGGPDGKQIKNNTNSIDFVENDDTTLATVRAAHISAGANANDLVTQFNLKGRIADIEFSFSGSNPPSPGDNANKFGICHTTGGSYTAGDVVYDDGSTLILMPTEVVLGITTRAEINGDINLIANGFYVLEDGTWVNKGSDSTGVKVIEIEYAWDDDSPKDSSTVIQSGSKILSVSNCVDVAFNGSSPSLSVILNGSSPLTLLSTTQNNLKKSAQYDVEEIRKVNEANAGKIRLNITPSTSTAGSGRVYVTYVSNIFS